MNKELDNVLIKFPAYRGRILELFSGNPDFKSLCEDYWLCRNNLNHFEFENRKIRSDKKQFTDLAHRLENEITRFLNSK
jgi:hypothetical protein